MRDSSDDAREIISFSVNTLDNMFIELVLAREWTRWLVGLDGWLDRTSICVLCTVSCVP